jgi:hypothetical protein
MVKMDKVIKILWDGLSVKGKIEAVRCRVIGLEVLSQGETDHTRFQVSGGQAGIRVVIGDIAGGIGANESTITIRSDVNPFTFKVRDVNRDYPIYIPKYNVIVTTGNDDRLFPEIRKSIVDKGLQTITEQMESAKEENFEDAVKGTLGEPCPTWLGITRDMRIFELGFQGMPTYDNLFNEPWHYIKPLKSSMPNNNKNPGSKGVLRYNYMIGRGISCSNKLERSLENDFLPILNARLEDGGILYSAKYFVTLEKSVLKKETIRGTHYLVSDSFSSCHLFTPEQEKEKDSLFDSEMDTNEETVLYFNITARNTSAVPAYAWVVIPQPIGPSLIRYDNKTGFVTVEDGFVCLIATMDGHPVEQVETAVLVPPGEQIEFQFMIPHDAISPERANHLRKHPFKTRLHECIAFWESKADEAMQVSLPEKRIENMMKAGFHHLDLLCFGKEPDGPIAPNVGFYCPIGTESSPIIQYMDSIGCTGYAQRALDYFYAKQQDTGFMQNFGFQGGYMGETGAVLWTSYLHTLYSNDTGWIREKEDKIVRACDFLIQWARNNMRDNLIGRGYGMVDGKVADPEDPYHAYMLNAYALAGLSGAVKMLETIRSSDTDRIRKATGELKKNILTAIDQSMADAPVVPLGDGSWCPAISPWPEHRGPLCLTTDGGGPNMCGGSIHVRDSIIGAIHLLSLGVIDIKSVYADFILDSFSQLYGERHTAGGQPNYSQHSFVNLRRGERKAFIKEFYNSFAGLADPQTYTFWENFMLVSFHKTHEEGWFLMKCRNMLYTEEINEECGNSLTLMPGVPNAWLVSGKPISISKAHTFFGELSFRVEHMDCCRKLTVSVHLKTKGANFPKLVVRIPLEKNMKIESVSKGRVIHDSSDIAIDDFSGDISFEVSIRLTEK